MRRLCAQQYIDLAPNLLDNVCGCVPSAYRMSSTQRLRMFLRMRIRLARRRVRLFVYSACHRSPLAEVLRHRCAPGVRRKVEHNNVKTRWAL